ncbi:MAG: hypothetical protein QW486_03630 [Candidatus Bathyarchaeia archaeon]|nr:hypothetical protein [Candidatus Bathyarchaeota archaeon]
MRDKLMDPAYLGLIVGSLVSIGAYTTLIGDNPISKATENLYLGILAGYLFATNWDYIYRNAVTKVQGGEVIYVIPIILSLMLLSRLKSGWMWLSRYPIVLSIGVGMGLAMRTTVMADFVQQIQATLLRWNSLENIVMIVGTITSAAYFIFTTTPTGPYRYVNRVGRLFLLVAFGVTYGQTVSFRFELVIGRLVEMLRPDVIWYTTGFLILVILILTLGYKTKRIEWYSET